MEKWATAGNSLKMFYKEKKKILVQKYVKKKIYVFSTDNNNYKKNIGAQYLGINV